MNLLVDLVEPAGQIADFQVNLRAGFRLADIVRGALGKPHEAGIIAADGQAYQVGILAQGVDLGGVLAGGGKYVEGASALAGDIGELCAHLLGCELGVGILCAHAGIGRVQRQRGRAHGRIGISQRHIVGWLRFLGGGGTGGEEGHGKEGDEPTHAGHRRSFRGCLIYETVRVCVAWCTELGHSTL